MTAFVLLVLVVWPAAATATTPSGDGIGVSVTVEPGAVDNNGLLPDTGGPAIWLLAASLGGCATGFVLLARSRRHPR